jgi:hypothetical protein
MASPVYEYEFENEGLPELEEESYELAHESAHELHEVSPIRKIYVDAMMEHLAHESAEAQSEHEAAEQFLPLIPLVASKLLPLAAKAIPKVVRALPKITRVVNRVTPQLTKGVTRITRTLFRNPRTRPLVRTIPSIARRTVANIARQAAIGRAVTPQTAVRTLAQQTRTVLRSPRHRALAMRRSRSLDRYAHRIAGTPQVIVNVGRSSCSCRPSPCCRSCGHLIR